MMNDECTHQEYYAQFVTRGLIYLVSTALGRQVIASTDEDFNDIALSIWDSLTSLMLESLPAIAKANGGGVSLSDKVCTLKAAARMYKSSPELVDKYSPV